MRKKTILNYASIIDGYEFARDKVDDLYIAIGYDNYCKSHFHKQMELYYIYRGKVEIELNRNKFTLNKGDLLICNPFDIHSFNKYGLALTFVISVPTRFMPYLEKCSGYSRFDGNIIRSSQDSRDIAKLMMRLAISRNKGDMKLLGYTMLIFSALTAAIGLSATNPQEDSLIYKIINYIDENYKEPISLETLASHCGYSKNYISREFNASFNCNINEYINLKRLQAFIALHDKSKDNVVDNALAVGFNSVRTFYNAFNEHFNMTPKEYFASQNKNK